MQRKILRAAVVGASSLLGKELAAQMADAPDQTWDVVLLDTDETSGNIAAAGSEALLVQPLAPGAFERMDVVFFSQDGELARTHWREAHNSGALVVDLTGALQKDGLATVLAPGASVVSAKVVAPVHPAALMLAGIALPLRSFGKVRLVATVLAPASEWGMTGMDDLQRQTVALLSLQGAPSDGIFDQQVAFNLTTQFGEQATVSLAELSAVVESDFLRLAPDCELTVQIVQAPVFHGYTISAFATASSELTLDALRAALAGSYVQLAAANESLSNSSIAGEQGIFTSVKQAGTGFWFWLASDNIALTAQTAIAAARELVNTG